MNPQWPGGLARHSPKGRRCSALVRPLLNHAGRAEILPAAIDTLEDDKLTGFRLLSEQKEQMMFQFTYRLKIAERVKARCERHPCYNPERDGRAGIRGGCSTCFSLFALYHARQSLEVAHREFMRRAAPWCRLHKRRARADQRQGSIKDACGAAVAP